MNGDRKVDEGMSAAEAEAKVDFLAGVLAQAESERRSLAEKLENAERWSRALAGEQQAAKELASEIAQRDAERALAETMERSKTAPASELMDILRKHSESPERLEKQEAKWMAEMAIRLAELGVDIEECDLGTGRSGELLAFLRGKASSSMGMLMDAGALSWGACAAHLRGKAKSGMANMWGIGQKELAWNASGDFASAGVGLFRAALLGNGVTVILSQYEEKARELFRFGKGRPAEHGELAGALREMAEQKAGSLLGRGPSIAVDKVKIWAKLAILALGEDEGASAAENFLAAANTRAERDRKMLPWAKAALAAIQANGAEAMEHILAKALEVDPHVLWAVMGGSGWVAHAAEARSIKCIDSLLDMGAPVVVGWANGKPVAASSPIEHLRAAAIAGNEEAKAACHRIMQRFVGTMVMMNGDFAHDKEGVDKRVQALLAGEKGSRAGQEGETALVESFVLDQTMRLAGPAPESSGIRQRL